MSRQGVMFFCDQLDRASLLDFAERVEQMHFDTLWLPELFGREVFASAGYLLALTERLMVASGIANVYARDAYGAAQAQQTLAELSGGRFILGLGVSNPQILETRGQSWRPPIEKLTEYFEQMTAARVYSPAPPHPAPVYLAAHGPKMLRLAATAADGANTYLMPVTHTQLARNVLGPNAALNVVQHCLLESDPERARGLARKAVSRYVRLAYYRRAWREFGFEDADFADGGSDRLIDMLVVWGDAGAIRERLDSHRAAGRS
nr:LLM class flavin-dependent oxidoreductase [Gammaproteobacteria bacterium]